MSEKKYIFKPYNAQFPKLFEQEKRRIAAHVKATCLIEHVGSTAIPHLGGKGIIDIAIAAAREELNRISEQLQELGYEFRPTFSTQDRLYFVAFLPDPEEGKRRYHIHLVTLESVEWQEFIGFRDYLRNHPEALLEYAELKKNAVLYAAQDGEKYRELKGPLFKKVHEAIKKRKKS